MAKITVHGGPTNATLDELEKEVEELEAEEYDEDLEDQAADEEELEDAEETGEQTLTLPKKVVRKSTAKKKWDAMSWYQLLDMLKQNQQEFEYFANEPPQACPLCGEPLVPGPPSAAATLFCRFDGWQFPRDWVRPERWA